MKLEITQVKPIGKKTHRVFGRCADGTSFYEVELDEFPASEYAKAFREARCRLRITLREAAEKLGLTVSELSALEHGAATCDWSLAYRMLVEVSP